MLVGHGSLGYRRESHYSDDVSTNGSLDSVEVQAFVQDSLLTITGDVTVKTTSDASIQAVIVAAAAAVSGGGTTGVGISGAAVYTENKIATLVQAYVASSSSQVVKANSFWVNGFSASSPRET